MLPPLLSEDKEASADKPTLTSAPAQGQPIRIPQPATAAPQAARAAGWEDTAKRWP